MSSAESLRDAIKDALKERITKTDRSEVFIYADDAAVGRAEAAALKWFADWLRSGIAEQLLPLVLTEANTSGTAAPHVVLHARADALTKENPHE